MTLAAVLKEAIRLDPTAPLRSVIAEGDQVIGDGKYFIPNGHPVAINTYVSQKDPKVWGEDVRVLARCSVGQR